MSLDSFPSQCLLEEPYVHRNVSLLMFKLQNCENMLSVSAGPILPSNIHLMISFWRLWKHSWDEKLLPASVCLPAARDLIEGFRD